MDLAWAQHYYRARDYNPVTGRWMQKDPIGFAGGDTNLYRYVNNDPINRIDPDGLQSLVTDMNNGTTTFDPFPYPGSPVTIPTRNDVTRSSLPGAGAPYSTPDVNWVPTGTQSPAYGPNGAYIDTGDPRGRDIHGGGSSLSDPYAPNQGWRPTQGCTRGQNADVQSLGNAINTFKSNYPGVSVPYSRIRIPWR